MDPVVLVPRRPEPWRDRLWSYVRERVDAEVDWPIHEGLSVDGPFNRSRALNEAATEGGDWEVAVILDADTVPPKNHMFWGTGWTMAKDHLVFAQNEFRSLTREATRKVLAGKLDPHAAPVRWVYPDPKSSCLLVSRTVWDRVGGFDERFEGWGGEDSAFACACQALAGLSRIRGACSHLWHPRSPEKNTNLPEYKANFALLDRYKAARKDPEAMRAILSEPGGPLA